MYKNLFTRCTEGKHISFDSLMDKMRVGLTHCQPPFVFIFWWRQTNEFLRGNHVTTLLLREKQIQERETWPCWPLPSNIAVHQSHTV